eukprot:12610479-Prorocentrum_lima.AAC.1
MSNNSEDADVLQPSTPIPTWGMGACLLACMRACVHACMRACGHACMREWVGGCFGVWVFGWLGVSWVARHQAHCEMVHVRKEQANRSSIEVRK